MNKTLTLIAILILLTPIAISAEYTEYYCENETTLVEHTYNELNETISKTYTNHPYGCKDGAPINISNEVKLGALALAALLAFIVINLALAYFFPRGSYQGLKILFLFISIASTWYMLQFTSLLTQQYTNITVVGQIYDSLTSLTTIYTWLTFFIVIIFTIYFIAGALGLITSQDQRGERNNQRP